MALSIFAWVPRQGCVIVSGIQALECCVSLSVTIMRFMLLASILFLPLFFSIHGVESCKLKAHTVHSVSLQHVAHLTLCSKP